MALKAIEAKIECDGCGFIYHVDLNPADSDLKSYMDLDAYVAHQIDVVGEHQLCPECLNKLTLKLPADVEDPTYDQVHEVFARTI